MRDRRPSAPREPVLVVENLRKHFVRSAWPRRRSVQKAVDGISFEIARGQTLGLIGESGSGKSTTGYCILRLTEPDCGVVRLNGIDVTGASSKRLRELRRDMQIIFQNPYASLDARQSVGAAIAEPLVACGTGSRAERRARVRQLLEQVGLDPDVERRYPREFSGGERQRICIARALSLHPSLIVCDEPVSALDVSVQAQILNLLRDLQDELGLTYLFISHDLAVVNAVSDQIAVMRDGQIVEMGTPEEISHTPSHAYTRELLEAAYIPTSRGETRVPPDGSLNGHR